MPSALLEFFDKIMAATMESDIPQVQMLYTVAPHLSLRASSWPKQTATCLTSAVYFHFNSLVLLKRKLTVIKNFH